MRIEITCSNRVGILQEIMQIFADFRVNVTSGELGGDSGDKVYLAAPGLLLAQFQSIERSLQRVPGVVRVRRVDMIPSERRHFELDTLLAHIADPVLSVDRRGRIIAANLAAARAFGVSQDQVAGMDLQRFLPQLELAELLRGFSAPRFGLPVAVRGRDYLLDWSPIALPEKTGSAASLAGAVLNLLPVPATTARAQLPEPAVLWDFDRRRESCLRLQQLAPLAEPLLIAGERGSGRSTFAAAAFYLAPIAERGSIYWWQGAESASFELSDLSAARVLVLDDLHLMPARQQQQLAGWLRQGRLTQRVIATAVAGADLLPGLAQLFAAQQLRLPPLRNMRPGMAAFVAALREVAELSLSIAVDVIPRIAVHDWPDNFSGLRDQLAAAEAHARARGSDLVESQDLPLVDMAERPPWGEWSEWGRGLSFPQMMEKLERSLLQELVRGGESTRTLAKRLGLSHTAVANKLRKFGIGAKQTGR